MVTPTDARPEGAPDAPRAGEGPSGGGSPDTGNQAVLLRFGGEISTKARATRLQFRRRLAANLRDALESAGSAPRLEVSHERIFVELPPDTSERSGGADAAGDARTAHPLNRVFGIQSLSWVERRGVTALDDVVRVGEALFRDVVRGRRFAVRARRVGPRERIPTRRVELERALGRALEPGAAGVDLDHPEATVHIELGVESSAFFAERLPGPGGLPLGVEGHAMALLSGGFDSAVAAWQILRRGVELDYVFCNLGGPTQLEEMFPVAKHLADHWSYGSRPRLHAIDFEPLVEALQQGTAKRYWQVLLKRLMLRAATVVAKERGAQALVTGDALGQVSSQTLQNIAVVSRATNETVLRPLVGCNKDEIIAQARRIGTYELSKQVAEYCALVPSKPATRASLAAIETEEAHLAPGLVETAVAQRSVFDLRALDPGALRLEGLAVEHVPEGATVIDLRTAEQFRSGHYTGALHLEFARALTAYEQFDRSQTYVLTCEFGLMSSQLADRMRRSGFRVHHFRGGQRALMRTDR